MEPAVVDAEAPRNQAPRQEPPAACVARGASVLYDDASVGEPGNYHVKKAIDVDVADGRLTLVIGNGTDPTFLGSMMIEPID